MQVSTLARPFERIPPRVGRLLPVLPLGIFGAEGALAVTNPSGVLPIVGVDYRLYMDAARRWLDGGGFYLPFQVAGPYPVLLGDVMYPPNALFLFVPACL